MQYVESQLALEHRAEEPHYSTLLNDVSTNLRRLPAQFMEYPLYKFAADIFFAAVLMASFRDYVKLVAMRYRSRVFFVVFPAVAYTLMLGTFNQMVQFVHSYL